MELDCKLEKEKDNRPDLNNAPVFVKKLQLLSAKTWSSLVKEMNIQIGPIVKHVWHVAFRLHNLVGFVINTAAYHQAFISFY